MSVPEHLDTVVLSGRLRQTNVLTPLEVMYSQLALAFTFCRIAETEVTFGDLKHARRVVAKTLLACNSLAGRTREPNPKHRVATRTQKALMTNRV